MMRTGRGAFRGVAGRALAARVVVLLLLWGIAVCGHAEVDARGEVARIKNSLIEAGINRTTGQLTELVDVKSSQNFGGRSPGIGGLWALEFGRGKTISQITPGDARNCEVEPLSNSAAGLRLIWSGFGAPATKDLRVEVTVALDENRAVSRWRINVNNPGGQEIARVRFPRLLCLPSLERERLVVPVWGGLVAREPRGVFAAPSAPARREYEYPGLCSMQCLAFYSEGGPGVYLASDDTAGYRKALAVFREGNDGLNLEMVHLPERADPPVTRYVLPYSVELGTFQGGWYEAAATYRSWATNQVWARESRWKRGLVPAWIGDTGLWVWNRGASTTVLDPALALQRRLGMPVSVFWHWWHGCTYDTGFPEYFPPREGSLSFTQALERAHASHVRALVYMNQRLWGMSTASWTNEGAARFAVKAADGRIVAEVYNQFTRLPCASMCMGTGFWRAKYSGLAARAWRELGVDGIYMDQACSSLACYDRLHGHPVGGGSYWMDGFRRLQANIRARCSERGGVALAGEGCAENWLPYLDVMLALDVSRERYAAPDGWEPIPFFQAVYHGYAVFFGNYSSLTFPPYDDLWPARFAPKEPLQLLDQKFSRQFCLEQARAFVWGQQPTIANFMPSHLRDRRAEMEYILRLAGLRKSALKYLQDGTMLSPPVVAVPEEEIAISRLSIYAGQREPLKEFSKKVAPVLASAWRAGDGTLAIAVASISQRALKPEIQLDVGALGLTAAGRFYALGDERSEVSCESRQKSLVVKPSLGPLDAQVFEWRDRSSADPQGIIQGDAATRFSR